MKQMSLGDNGFESKTKRTRKRECETLNVSTSGCYAWQHRPLCERGKANAGLTVRIRQAHQASDETYGMPRS